MAIDPAVQTSIASADSTQKIGTAYSVTSKIGEQTVVWQSSNKLDLKDTIGAAIDATNIHEIRVLVVPV